MAKLYIICGHGAGDPGAVGNGYKEAERVRALGSRMAALGGAEVELLDTSRNWYADGGLNSLKIPKGACVLELHLDSAARGARGGHVIIHTKFDADKYDIALATFIAGYFPGRSAIIVKRSNLANVNRAAARGINYRLLETCFISNAQDMAKFNASIDEVAAGILAAFGISASGASAGAAEAPKPAETKPQAASKPAQAASLAVDGIWGQATTKALQKALGTPVDGIVSGQSASALQKVNKGGLASASWKTGRGGSAMVRALQKKLGVAQDGLFGPNTCKALQKKLGTVADGYVSKPSAMVKALQKALNNGTF